MQTEAIDQIIKDINDLSPQEKKALCATVRTTPEGIRAYQAFLFGATATQEDTRPTDDNREDNPSETPPSTDDSEIPPVDDNDEVPPPEVPDVNPNPDV